MLTVVRVGLYIVGRVVLCRPKGPMNVLVMNKGGKKLTKIKKILTFSAGKGVNKHFQEKYKSVPEVWQYVTQSFKNPCSLRKR